MPLLRRSPDPIGALQLEQRLNALENSPETASKPATEDQDLRQLSCHFRSSSASSSGLIPAPLSCADRRSRRPENSAPLGCAVWPRSQDSVSRAVSATSRVRS